MPEDSGPTARLDPVSIRDVWPNEAQDLTPWLAERPDFLGDALELELELEGQEMAVGGYSADLVFRDADQGSRVVVENMYGTTDHDHIGKLITYAAGLDAGHVVLLAESFRPEHRTALNWLNRVSTEDCTFFGLVLEAWRIDDSRPAPHLRVEVQPDDWSRTVRATVAGGHSRLSALYVQFWSEILEGLHQAEEVWRRRRTPGTGSWMDFRNDTKHGVAYIGSFCRHDGERRLRAEARLDTFDAEETAALYRQLDARRSEIEQSFGAALAWEPHEDYRFSRVAAYFPGSMTIEEADEDSEQRQEAKRWLIDAVCRLRGAMSPVLEELWDMEEWD
ncbi:MAG: DUF4268 domain-containing protein [Acidimicrobiaceae bacterium]|nr:DUF4268 domain-containing protein [Acidimicrobiaceae bacterium]MXZ52183.1 DUF4268 domain-containing protein [Acidimicrobiaceae bacterium]MYB87634.1 DUF4268 domain-containing protein [Acidimicrobiaceae bacterium]MYH92848.1 DUF4268 domain-containing protein [Acidimicrobiaceae bacterium]